MHVAKKERQIRPLELENIRGAKDCLKIVKEVMFLGFGN